MSNLTPTKIWLSPPHMGDMELKLVQEAFEGNWIAPVGPNLPAFESELAAYNSIGHCAALSSGTAAIHLALIALGVAAGDEVMCATFTFSGSANPIAYCGARPVFVDSERETWNMDPDLLDYAIGDRIKITGRAPKAIIMVHLYGMPAKIDRIMSIGRKHGVPVIEDAAEALGSEFKGKKLGTYGDFGIYSFNGNKIITTSGGGALVSDNKEWIDQARFLATQARDPAPHYQHSQIGYNYRLSNICAAIGRGQLLALPERIKSRRRNFDYYRERLSSIPGIQFSGEPEAGYSNRWLTTILVDPTGTGGVSRETIRLALDGQNIESRPLWKPMHLQPVFRDAVCYENGVSQALFDVGLCLPSGSNLSDDDLDRVASLVLRTLNRQANK